MHTCFTAVPSANASTLDKVMRWPSARDCAMALAAVLSTPMTSTWTQALFRQLDTHMQIQPTAAGQAEAQPIEPPQHTKLGLDL